MGEFVRIERKSHGNGDASDNSMVAWVTLDRADLHNAFNEVMIRELHEAFSTLGRQADIRAIVLTGEGKSFCAGADLNWMKKMVDYTFAENVQDAHALSAMLKTIHDCPKPVIARIQGAAFGGGIGLLSACDMAVSVESATFCLSEVKLGLLPAVISPFVLTKISISAAQRYFLTAEKFSAPEALRIGLIAEMVPDIAALDAKVDALLDALLANGPEAVAQCKVLISHVRRIDWERAVDITTKMIAERRASAEGQEGMRAFLEKRPPQWLSKQGEPAKS
jgi:methylglutaconyl-CoA hydratase